ncbi:GNAT family N-acetyltransferase [Actomonas aquatica]|uniref:GNAT family N-acetyltransferase n=1 Tax=Actomonas aquatica TaxID=2866162 RepID=A0ABZ1C1U6_9BACT|nr:GNAT family N-acetyltransferase [Opitutus sp. WL0086]WRQ85589.1 GNAT family N-acetyltransferase [Opitutus sp. WL0086]
MNHTLRPATEADLPALAAIYIDAVRTLGPESYSERQVDAWAKWPSEEPDAFRDRIFAGDAWVAEIDGKPAAFAVFTAPDHLDFLYTKGEFARRGLATALHTKLEIIANAKGAPFLRTEASYLSRPVFNRFGYRVTAIERVERFGETFTRFLMRKRLSVGPPATGPAVAVISEHEASFAVTPVVAAEENVTVRRFDENNPGWFSGSDPRGVPGYFPAAWFQIDEIQHRASALRDYAAVELNVGVGDLVHVISTVNNWHLVVTADGLHEGWIPGDCLPPVTDSADWQPA